MNNLFKRLNQEIIHNKKKMKWVRKMKSPAAVKHNENTAALIEDLTELNKNKT